MDELPLDTIYNILSRIPVKSLVCFQCVCKQWCRYINDSYLATIHARRVVEEPPTCIIFHLPAGDGDHSKLPCTLSFSDTIYSRELTTTVIEVSKNPIMEFECKKRASSFPVNDIILGSCNGLLYSSRQHHNRAQFNFVVIHPLRKECYELPPNDIWLYKSPFIEQESCGLGFDDSTNTFKMVCVLLQGYVSSSEFYNVSENLCTMVHVLGTDSWRRMPQVPSYPIRGEGIFAHGRLHWLVSCLDYSPTNELGRKVICFDVKKEEFGLIDAPKQTFFNWVDEHLVGLHNEVGFVYHDSVDLKIVVLVLKGKEWEMHCCFDKRPPLPNRYIKVLGFWNKAGDIVMTNQYRNRLFVYSVKKGALYEVSVLDQYAGLIDDEDIRIYQSNLYSMHGIKTNRVNYTFAEFDE